MSGLFDHLKEMLHGRKWFTRDGMQITAAEAGALLANLERSRNVGLLDEWENGEKGRRIEITPWPAGGYFAVFYGTYRGAENTELHNAPKEPARTRDAARAAAVAAIDRGEV